MKVRLTHCLNVLSSFILAVAILSASLVPAQTVHAAKLAQGIPLVTMLTPAEDSTTYASTAHPRALPTFTWEAVPGAKSYRLEIDTSPGFNSVDLVTVTTSFNRWAPTVANLPDKTAGLWWRVKVRSHSDFPGDEGAFGDAWRFFLDWKQTGPGPDDYNRPEILSPEDGAAMAFTDHPTFSWTPVLGASYYNIRFSLNETFSDVEFQATTLSTTYQLIDKLADGVYYWQVIPRQDGDPDWVGKESETRTVEFNYNTAHIPALVAPEDGSEQQFTPTFRWTPVYGAEVYSLEYSTDPTFATKETISTPATSYTPTSPLANDQNYYWRVRVLSGDSNNPVYTDTWNFYKKWYPPVILLTPTNGYPYTVDPYFSWAPVPGAASYRLEMDDQDSFPSPTAAVTTNTFYVHRVTSYNCAQPDNVVYWRIIPLDSNSQRGEPSATWTFDCNAPAGAPVQVYPNYYYNPTTNPPMDPHEDNTVPLPVFLWKRVLNGVERTQSAAYRIQVATSAGFEAGTVRYTFETENMNAVPNLSSLLPPGGGQTDYFWRVRPLTALGGAETGQWSQVWRMRHNPALLPAATASIQPLRPADRSEWAETVPLFEWMPLQGATSYQVQISMNSDMSSPVGTYAVDYPAYSHPYRMAPATYYWRVQGMNGATPLGWSTPIRFQIAMQSRWRSERSLGANNATVVSSDPPGDAVNATYELTNLYITQGGSNWYFGFNAGGGADMRYAIYVDADHVENSGAGLDPLGYDVTTIPAFRPEAVIYVDKIAGVFSADTTRVFNWNSGTNTWNPVQFLSSLTGTGITYDVATGYLELTVRGSYVGQSTEANSHAVSVFSVPWSGGEPQDSVPSDPIFAPGYTGSNILSRFISVTDRVTLLTPPYRVTADPKVFSTIPAFIWQPVVEVPETTYYRLRIGVDPNLTSWISQNNNDNPAVYTFLNDIEGDNTYYWQVRAVYNNGTSLGGWGQAGKMERMGRPALGLSVTQELWRPVLSWTLAEGAYSYTLQIDDDAAFASPVRVSVTTRLNTFTPNSSYFIDGTTYYARVRVNRTSAINNIYTNAITFTVQRPQVTGLHTHPEMSEGSPAQYNPTYCWNPIASAWRYRLEIFWDSTFLIPYNFVLTEENCYTFPAGQLDGSFFWRVKMMDGTDQYGPPSAPGQTWKFYPAPTPLEPLKAAEGTPLFKWSPVDGADRYRIQISDKSDFSNIEYTATTVNNEHQPTQKLNFGDYYWRVQIIDDDKIYGPFSDFVYVEFYKVFLPGIRK
jgi:hypothetical protein